MSNAHHQGSTQKPIDHSTWQWKVFLAYDIFIMVLIIANISSLAVHHIILSDFGEWIAQFATISEQRIQYISFADPYIRLIDRWFIIYLIFELGVRWFIAILGRHHRKWWFFPFVHWYEVLAIIPQLRFLRLLRAGVIAYRLHELGYKVITNGMVRRVKFYYDLVLEELTSRIVLTVIGQVEKEIKTSSTHRQMIHNIIDHHRVQFAEVLAETLQHSFATSLAQNRIIISQNIGQIVNKAVEDTPELTQLLRLMPFVGTKVEHLIQSIGQRLGENITNGIITPLSIENSNKNHNANPLLSEIATEISKIPLNSEKIDDLVESIVIESLEAIKHQVNIKQWQQILDETQNSR